MTVKKKRNPADTPMMMQYLSVKAKYPDAILFYRMGDFYEMFFEDAVVASKVLELTLTSRNKNDPSPIAMCGAPHHASLKYIARLINAGYKVAVCDQMEDPATVKGLVKREVVRVITPGVIMDEHNLTASSNNYFAAVSISKDEGENKYAIAVVDASTNEFKGTVVNSMGDLATEIYRLEPKEILISKDDKEQLFPLGSLLPSCFITVDDKNRFDDDSARQYLEDVFNASESLKILSFDKLLVSTVGAAASYIKSMRPKDKINFPRFYHYKLNDYLVLDDNTKRHLELVRTVSGEKKGSLIHLLDMTLTGMGARLLKQRLNYPLMDVSRIRRRLDVVETFHGDSVLRHRVRQILKKITDIERIAARVGVAGVSPLDLGSLRNSLQLLPELNAALATSLAPDADEIFEGPVDEANDIFDVLCKALIREPPASSKNGFIFNRGFNSELDKLADMVKEAKDFFASYEAQQRKITKINSLKVSYNKVFGYYIEVTKPNIKYVPENYIRKQTLVGGERFLTPELQKWESKIIYADERRRVLEQDIFNSLVADLGEHVLRLGDIAARIASIDCSAGLAELAAQNDYVRPLVDENSIIDIKDGRHPLVEILHPAEPFVPNDVCISLNGERMLIITGPNMAGKSTVMRQVALSIILAQMGAFIPALSAKIGVCDRLFTRIGASDDISRGDSTFMVEMKETSSILSNATKRSFVILDEVGRGTGTYDGMSIAWAVGEYLHDNVGCKVMFATHYHELVDLAKSSSNVANYHMAAREYGDNVVFLRKLVKGATSHSYGIQVAKMAGLPDAVLKRAKDVMKMLEGEGSNKVTKMPRKQKSNVSEQLPLFNYQKPSEVESALKEINIDKITPLEALSLLSKLKDKLN